jgi:8-oxo-dGTP diphosphatase
VSKEMANAIIKKGDKILIIKRSDIPIWEFPSGKKENNETFKQAAIRETKEETGLVVEIEYELGKYENKLLFRNVISKTFVCKIKSGKITKNREVIDFKFVDPKKLPSDFGFWLKSTTNDFIKNKKNVNIKQKFGLITCFKFLIKNPHFSFYPFSILKNLIRN